MMIKFIIRCLSLILATLPDCVLKTICNLIGLIGYFFLPAKTRVLKSNLHHAFPTMQPQEINRKSRISWCRCIEMGMIALISPSWSKNKIKQRFAITTELDALLNKYVKNPQPTLLIYPHLTLMEAGTFIPILSSAKIPRVGVLYRNLENRHLEEYVKNTRSRFGIDLFPRKKGFLGFKDRLKSNQIVAMAFDQNAGDNGLLGSFMNRICSNSPLLSTLCKIKNTQCILVYTERKSFGCGIIRHHVLEFSPKSHNVIINSNQFLENLLIKEPVYQNNWLWIHDRWKNQIHYRKRFQIASKYNQFKSYQEYPKNTRLAIRVSNWLGDIVMSLPHIRAIREARPDMRITVLAPEIHTTWLLKIRISDQVISLPPKGCSRFSFFYKMRHQYYDTYLNFTNSLRSDIEAFLTRTPQRFGLEQPRIKRSLLTNTYKIPDSFNNKQTHQHTIWEAMMTHFGIPQHIDKTPLVWNPNFVRPNHRKEIAIIPGSENNPEKRWPVEYWNALIEKIVTIEPEIRFVILGTSNDATSAKPIGFCRHYVDNITGETNMTQLLDILSKSSLVIGNDTGGVHLANAVGTPSIVLFGPTNPLKTSPIYDGKMKILQPPNYPSTGGGPMKEIQVNQVLDSFLELYSPEKSSVY